MTKPTLLVTGGSGQVGNGIRYSNRDRFDLFMPGRDELDLANPAAIKSAIEAGEWSAIINCAAYTAVDKAESDEAAAFAINAEAPRIIAEAAASRSIPLLHVSTDYVFDGTKDAPYVEDDPVAPLGVYGASKEAGERVVRAAGGQHVILRTAWVVSPWGTNFLKTMLRLGRERDRVGVVADQIGCPTSAMDIAETLLCLTERLLGNPALSGGTYHFVNSGEASWHALAAHVFARASDAGAPTPLLDAITSADYPTPAKRPANSRLSSKKIESEFGISPRPWVSAVDEILEQLG